MVNVRVEPTGAPFGAVVRGLDLRDGLDEAASDFLRGVWLRYQVVAFPDQELSFAELEAVATAFGPIGEDPYFRPIPGQSHVVGLTREADETSPLFADVWHSDWSFLPSPPAGTLLYGVEIPPSGGDTMFADQYAAYDGLPDALKGRIEGLLGIHSARRGYSKAGLYGDRDTERSMRIVASDDALATQLHPLVRPHPETGRRALVLQPRLHHRHRRARRGRRERAPRRAVPAPGARTSTSTGTGGRRAWSRSGTTAACSTRPPEATKGTVASSTA